MAKATAPKAGKGTGKPAPKPTGKPKSGKMC